MKTATKKLSQLSDVQKRIAVCKDVIANIQAAQLNVVPNNGYIVGLNMELEDSDVIHHMLPLIKKKCEVCARGAMMICKIDKFNSCNYINLNDVEQSDTAEQLDFFEEDQLNLIETAFELSDMSDGYGRYNYNHSKETIDAIKFGEDFDDPSDRLMAIMQNIVDHKGEFKPEVRYSIVKA